MSSLIEMGQRAKDAAVVLATLSTPAKNKALLASADALLAAKAEILAMWMRQWKQASRAHLSTD